MNSIYFKAIQTAVFYQKNTYKIFRLKFIMFLDLEVSCDQNKNLKRVIKGMKKCGEGCPACPYIKEGKSVKINNKEGKINKPYDCSSFNVVYAVICKKEKCKKAYLGKTKKCQSFI